MANDQERRWWISWYGPFAVFDLRWPLWVTGSTLGDRQTFCAAVIAPTEEAAWKMIEEGYSELTAIEHRFCIARPADWSPFNDRFPADDWMLDVWPANTGIAERQRPNTA